VKDAERIAHDYLHTDPSHRDPDTPIIKTKQMHEPIHFIGFFGPWDRNYWTVKNIIIFPIVFLFNRLCFFFSRNHPMKQQNRYYMPIIIRKFMLNSSEINR
jgi:hypothetical protein